MYVKNTHRCFSLDRAVPFPSFFPNVFLLQIVWCADLHICFSARVLIAVGIERPNHLAAIAICTISLSRSLQPQRELVSL